MEEGERTVTSRGGEEEEGRNVGRWNGVTKVDVTGPERKEGREKIRSSQLTRSSNVSVFSSESTTLAD